MLRLRADAPGRLSSSGWIPVGNGQRVQHIRQPVRHHLLWRVCAYIPRNPRAGRGHVLGKHPPLVRIASSSIFQYLSILLPMPTPLETFQSLLRELFQFKASPIWTSACTLRIMNLARLDGEMAQDRSSGPRGRGHRRNARRDIRAPVLDAHRAQGEINQAGAIDDDGNVVDKEVVGLKKVKNT